MAEERIQRRLAAILAADGGPIAEMAWREAVLGILRRSQKIGQGA